MNNYKKLKIFLYLSIPPVLLFLFLLSLVVFMGYSQDSSQYLLIFFIAFLSVIIFQIIIFKARVLSEFTEIDRLQKAITDQGTGAKMLIRRDLELTRVNEKLHELDEIKSNFLSIVAHQLRTPLSGIKWTTNMLLNGDMGQLNDDQKTFLMKSYESNNRMIKLVNDMLDADRIQSGKTRYEVKPINIVDLLDNVLFEVSPQASKKNILVEFKSAMENLPQVYVDPETIRAVLQNLLENSIKYTMNSGKIELDVKDKGDNLEVSISDNGIGIPEDQRKNVFEKFFRGRNALKFETDGSGLGLNIAKTIVEKNGGKIWFDSTEGHGSTFYFTLPVWKGESKDIKK